MLIKIHREAMNRFFVEFKDESKDKNEKFELRYTVFQNEKYLGFVQAIKAANVKFDEAEPINNLISRISRAPGQLLDLAHCAFNPIHGTEDWPKERIEKIFDLDHLELITQVWVKNKVMNPEFDPKLDPHLAPPK